MTTNLLYLIAIAFYVITWILITKGVLANIKNPEEQTKPSRLYFLTWAIALIAHIICNIKPVIDAEGLSFNFIALGSYVMWFISFLSIILFIISGSNSDSGIALNSGLGFHVLVSLLAYSTLMLAAVQAILLAMQNNYLHQRLKNSKQSNFFLTLPALEDMEYFLFHLIGVGVLLLSISLLSGFYYLENFFGSNVAHKTILSILSWIIFSALLIGRLKIGWRGKKAVRFTLSGFAVLALAFFGSKFIQEFVINKEVAYIQIEIQKKTPPYFLMISSTMLRPTSIFPYGNYSTTFLSPRETRKANS